MKTHSSRWVTIIISLCLVSAIFIGCTKQSAETASTTSTSPDQSTEIPATATSPSAPVAPKTDTTPITMTAIEHPQLVKNNWGEDDVSKEITAKTGVTMNMTYQATWDDKQLSTLLASGSKLPDFIIVDTQSSQTMANLLVAQGYVQPLNKLAEKYSPDFFKYLPKDMDKINQAADGNLYGVGDLYGDYSKTADLKVSSYVDSGLAIQKGLLGSNSIETLADFKDTVLKVKAANPGMKNPIMLDSFDPTNYRSIIQIVNKIYGGQPVISIAKDDTVHLNFKDESYVNAIKYVGDLYRSKLIPAESFTMADDQKKQALTNNDVFAYFGFYQNLGIKIPTTFTKDTPYWTVDLPTAPGVSRDKIKLFDQYSGLGGWHTVFISKDAKNPERAIQYLTFLLSDEGQILQRLGVKGKGYEDDPNGGFVFSQTRKDLTKNAVDKLGTQLGVDNWNWTWLEEFHSVMIGEALNAKELPAMQDYYDRYVKYASNERINLLTAKITDADMILLRAKIDDLWKNATTKMVLETSEEKLMADYKTFLDQAEKLGLRKLEAAYTENYKKWKAQLSK